MITIHEIFYIICGYLSGSVLYSYLLPKYLKHMDVTQVSNDGNPGAANVFMHAGIPMGILVLFLELLKGFIPIHMALRTLDPARLPFGLVLAAPVLGHAYPFLNRKRGGKAIAVSFGVLLGLFPICEPVFALIFFYLLFSLCIIIRPHFYRSIVTFLLFFGMVLLRVPMEGIVLGCGLIAAIVIRKHFVRYHGEKMEVRVPIHLRDENT
ncbi:MAG: glycerol-3-phosphate acyltransferase [Lachnospiraceae bacterium]|nr:glycerol-3-phosphate acyltransferase [Lachnospiraceae bacterium]